MNCTHQALYAKKDNLYCHICRALLRSNAEPNKQKVR